MRGIMKSSCQKYNLELTKFIDLTISLLEKNRGKEMY